MKEAGIRHILDGYDPAYKLFIKNWGLVCDINKVEKQNIILVDDLPNDDELLSITTAAGFLIRRTSEFIPCANGCGRAVLAKELWERGRNHWDFAPFEYTDICSRCSTSS